jgi:hypothetical protein
MKAPILTPVTFAPAARTIDFGFAIDPQRVYGVFNVTRGVTYYVPGSAALAPTFSGAVMTLNASLTAGLGSALAGDELLIIYEQDEALPAGAATAANQTAGNTVLANILTELGAKLEPGDLLTLATEATLAAINAKVPALVGGRLPVDGPLTNAQLRDTALPVSGPATNAEMRATPLPVTEPALVLTGAAVQTATVNNILESPSGATGTNVEGYRSASVQVVSTGTGGTFIFEQSNTGLASDWQPVVVKNSALTTGAVIAAAITASASSIIYRFPIGARFIRLRIATTITGGSIQAFSRLSTEPYTDIVQNIGQPTAGSLNATIASPVLAAGTALSNDVGIQVRANATGAGSFANLLSPATPAGQVVKSGAGRIFAIIATNTGAAVRYLKLFNATSITPGTTAATYQYAIPANGIIQIEVPVGWSHGTGIVAMVTGGQPLTDNTAITANEVTGVIVFA